MQPPPLIIHQPPVFKFISGNKFCLRICVAMPCIILWTLVIFIYSIYNIIYIIPLISNTYWYDFNPNNQLTQENFPIFKHIISFEANIYAGNRDDHQKKGWIMFSIMHYLIFWLVVSIVRTMKTDPGGTPLPDSPWAVKIESLANNYLEEAMITLKKNRKAEIRGFLKKGSLNVISEYKPSECSQFTQKMLSEPSRIGFMGEIHEVSQKQQNESQPENFHSGSELLSDEFNDKEAEEMNRLALEMVMSREFFRYCAFCKCFKPLRTHHCQQCMRCILKMDHHCQWVLNCIGFRNYKFFMNMIIYSLLALFFFLLSFTRCIVDVVLNPYIDGFVIYISLFAYILGWVLFLIVIVFAGFHFWLIYRSKTTLEFFEKDRKKKKETSKKKNRRIIDYDQGIIDNFIAVFNRNPLLWFFPVNPNDSVDGLYQEYENRIIEESSN